MRYVPLGALWLASGDLDLRRFYRFGTWSVEYFLLRGLGRSLAVDDIGLRHQPAFDMLCEANGIEHRLTKPTNGQVERMNRTLGRNGSGLLRFAPPVASLVRLNAQSMWN